MKKTKENTKESNNHNDWLTVNEAVKATKASNKNISPSDIYRNALAGKVTLSIYFQSPITLKKIKTLNKKIKLKGAAHPHCINLTSISEISSCKYQNLIVSTEEDFIHPVFQVMDTNLIGYEYVLVQRLLAQSLDIPFPIMGAIKNNLGISIAFENQLYQVFSFQPNKTPTNYCKPETIGINKRFKPEHLNTSHQYFPLFDLPQDACFVIRRPELVKMMNTTSNEEKITASATRMSSPLSRLFWLACKHNDDISPLIKQPYKLLYIFEQWALAEGITDRLSGDTLKAALERGTPNKS